MGKLCHVSLPNYSTNSFRLRSIRHRASIYWNRRLKSRLWICYQDGGLSEEKEEACEQTYGFMALAMYLSAESELLLEILPLNRRCEALFGDANQIDLKSQLQELIPKQQDRLKKLKSEHGKVQLGNITVDMVIGGMRGMTGLLWETSLLTRKRKYYLLPSLEGNIARESIVPSKEQVEALSKDMANRAAVPDYVYNAIDALPSTAHPMTQFASGVMALQV
ncbi:unnamed protein product [Brassica rapa subsp. trilocularis]